MSDDAITLENFNLVSGPDYAARGYPHEIWTQLRREDPVHWYDNPHPGGPSFWAVTKSEDIQTVGRHPEIFLNGPRLVLDNEADDSDAGFPKTLIQMDPPKHTDYRKLASKRFTPGRLRKLHGDIEALAKEIIDSLLAEGREGECDFVEKVAAPLPIAVIAWLLGVPREDWRLLFDWTNRTIGANDPDFIGEGKTGRETALEAMTELFSYFTGLVAERRKNPTDDLVTFFAHMEVDGKPIPEMDVLTWCLIIVIAGNETTRNATTGGMLALIEHRDQLRKVQGQPELLPHAVEEILRWTSPIIHFCRTASRDTELAGRKIEAGQHLALFYPSANRDEDVFEDPFTFRVDRHPNRHLAFGVGEHFCLGAHVARLEMEFAYRFLLPRIDEIELAGPVVRLHSALVGGVNKLPIRYRWRDVVESRREFFTRGGGDETSSMRFKYVPGLLAVAAAALVATDLGVGLLYRAVVGDSFYYSVVHTDRGRNRRYRTASEIYHHDLAKKVAMPAVWGDEYFVYTNSLGFRDREVRDVPLHVEGPRILLIGDSFAEGVRVDFEDSLAGILAAHFRPYGVDVLNAGVSSYSPTIYERKVRYLIEDVGLEFSHLIVLLDVGDIHEEAYRYGLDRDGNVTGPGQSFGDSKVKAWLREYSILYGLPRVVRGWVRPPLPPPTERNVSVDSPEGRWTIDEALYREYGQRGLRRARERMDALAELLRDRGIGLSVVVYPWPTQIAHGDRDSRHARYWAEWARRRGAALIDLFPLFVSEDPAENERTIRTLFIAHDIHWNEAGHRRAAEAIIARLGDVL